MKMEWNTVQQPAKVPQVGQTIIFDVIALSGAKFACAVGFGVAGFGISLAPVQFFMWATGGLLSVILFAALVVEWNAQLELFDLHVKQNKPPQVTEVHNHYNTQSGQQQTIHKYANPPTSDFIVWLYNLRVADGRIPDERACEKQWRQSADEWLTILEKEGIISKLHPSGKTGRRWNPDVKLEDALGKFGYDLSPALLDDKSS